MEERIEPSPWLVDGILRTGRRRVSLACGKPRVGKSTLAHELCVAVSKGIKFLGRDTMRSEVLLWQSEEETEDIQQVFKRLHYDPRTDEKILVLERNCKNTMQNLLRVLQDNKGIRLCVIETLDKCLHVKDILSNTAAQERFEEFDQLVVKPLEGRVSFLGLHHEKKRRLGGGIRDSILGATAVAAEIDSLIFLERDEYDDNRRIITVDTRIGEDINPTYLVYDETTRTNTLGETIDAAQAQRANATDKRIEEDIVKFFLAHPEGAQFEKGCLLEIKGKRDSVRRVFRKVETERLEHTGTGVSGDPIIYRLKAIPVEDGPHTVTVPNPAKVIAETKSPIDLKTFDAAMKSERDPTRRLALLAEYRTQRQASEVIQ